MSPRATNYQAAWNDLRRKLQRENRVADYGERARVLCEVRTMMDRVLGRHRKGLGQYKGRAKQCLQSAEK